MFGSLLVLRFVTGLHAGLPDAVSEWLDTPAGANLRDPQTVLNPDATGVLHEQLGLAFPNAPGTPDLVLNAIRASLDSALHAVFLIGALVMLIGFVSSVVWREVPMRRRTSPSVREPAAVGASAGPTGRR